jgi:hypothetical protein
VFVGKDVIFGSLQEVIAMMQQMKASMPPGKSVLQEYLKKLTAGIPRKLFRYIHVYSISASCPIILTLHFKQAQDHITEVVVSISANQMLEI